MIDLIGEELNLGPVKDVSSISDSLELMPGGYILVKPSLLFLGGPSGLLGGPVRAFGFPLARLERPGCFLRVLAGPLPGAFCGSPGAAFAPKTRTGRGRIDGVLRPPRGCFRGVGLYGLGAFWVPCGVLWGLPGAPASFFGWFFISQGLTDIH